MFSFMDVAEKPFQVETFLLLLFFFCHGMREENFHNNKTHKKRLTEPKCQHFMILLQRILFLFFFFEKIFPFNMLFK